MTVQSEPGQSVPEQAEPEQADPQQAAPEHAGLGQTEPANGATEPVTERETARRRLEARRDFGSHLVAYLVINSLLVVIWAITGAGYFWPIWVIAPWGAGLALHAWDVFLRKPVTEADVDAELRRHQG